MKVALLFFLFGLALCQSDCLLQGSYACSGGDIKGIDFGDDEDDDFFELFRSFGDSSTAESCTTIQQGTYSITADTASIEFGTDDDDCQIVGDLSSGCTCETSLDIIFSDACGTATLSTGEICTPATDCSDQYTCPGGATPIDDADNEPDANGCGPSAFPLAGPSFGFLECCAQHDFCYGTCGTSRTQCDNDFFECMSCSCQADYEDDYFGKAFCEEIACSYYQAVNEFGCFSFTSGQEDGCSCPGKAAEKKSQNMVSMSKFGPIHPMLRETDAFFL
mmetsp:Transcript_117570/g.175597  ORF Transcript_117570/g.175597 Transcript_117570/m.175597 type:complete len:277 (+) Transcript_117570:49-879(+)